MNVLPKGHIISRDFNAISKRYAFVLPRFGDGIIGGEVSLVGSLASELVKRGNHIEIFTTCARDNRTWENEYAPGNGKVNGIPVIRFPVDERNLESWIPLQIQISEGRRLSIDEQFEWMNESVNSQELYQHIFTNADSFDALFFAPYLFGTTFWGSLIRPDKSYLIPCLHDEHYAYVDLIGSMFRQVSGAIFNAYPEQELAESLYGQLPGGEVGMGFVPHTDSYLESLKPYFEEEFPYLLYMGRKETGKNVHLLVDYFIELKKECPELSDLKLVIVGGGSFSDLNRPDALLRDDVIDLAGVSEQEKERLFRHASVFCQPSTNESFSIVIMEAWLLGTPVLVHAQCAVTRQHVVDSNAGFYFSNRDDFIGTVRELISNKRQTEKMGELGLSYVKRRYSWEAVLERFDSVMSGLLS